MYLSPIFIISFLLASAEFVLGGSRFFEAKAPNKRTNPSPNYVTTETLNATSQLARRGISIKNLPGDDGAPRLWPNRKIRYCYDDKDPDAVVRGLCHQAIEAWAVLRDQHGFSYEEVTDAECESQRKTVLRIYYNSEGRLASTLGIPPINEAANRKDPENAIEGPLSHLSDMEGIGQDDITANVAHELGHVWGLYHEHQNPHYWKVTSGDVGWSFPTKTDADVRFQTNKFNCQNLKDYDVARARVQEKIDKMVEEIAKLQDQEKIKQKTKEKGDLETELSRLCVSQVVAAKHRFSAAEWIPLANTVNVEMDDQFDPDSLMMYPSGAGGKGLSDDRLVVMSYQDGSPIPNRLAPSAMDYSRLIALYGTTAATTPGTVHTSKSSKLRNLFKSSRNKNKRAGDTAAGLC
ncbi:uncharacterized protein N0V89_010257 [Didymosphaeria variabile]|uniref:Peptidase metallopeptidase domain-containing protein n=1 Tax=Didymosphaeria variabile TaxID=1932322 RepID=A0A9W9C6D4_9PLEO|nr:uncharacterized protein N0V89_010257 [Didymosphaeria variabile]KAJ4346328.1 hypothetical protein N0V89_010257 [Didymosphaeria variabile]